MHPRARRKFILDELQKAQAVNYTELANQLEVSTMTVRRDLSYMSEQGIVTLVHGGAVLNQGATTIYSLKMRENQQAEEKNRIGSYCANLVKESDCIFIDSGSTPKTIASALLERKNIFVMTNSLPVLNILSNVKNIKLLAVPGIYTDVCRGFTGQTTSDFIRDFNIDILFVGVSALNIEQAMMTSELMDANTKRSLIRQAKKVILPIDHTKLNSSSLITFGQLSDIDLVVTSKEANKDFIKNLRYHNVPVELV